MIEREAVNCNNAMMDFNEMKVKYIYDSDEDVSSVDSLEDILTDE
jgi:hypothetical protein